MGVARMRHAWSRQARAHPEGGQRLPCGVLGLEGWRPIQRGPGEAHLAGKNLARGCNKHWTNAAGAGREGGAVHFRARPRMTLSYRFGTIPIALLLAAVPATVALAAVDCRAPRMTAADLAICTDPQLARMDDQLVRRLQKTARQLAFGPYVGLRVWQSDWRQQRSECSADRVCLNAAYNDANRFLDRFQRCLGTSLRGRRCLPVSVEGERAAARRP